MAPAGAATAAMADPDDSFVARWSRRKRRDIQREETAKPSDSESGERVETEPSEDEIVAQLPDIESLDESADFTVFLKKGVPEELRKRALRRLWRLNPVFANLDGLNDYDEDFNTAAKLLEGVKTLYQVGKGMPGPAESQDEETQTDGLEPSVPIEAESKSQPQEIAETPAAPDAEPRERAASQENVEPAAPEHRDQFAGKASGRSAAERRWGRTES